MDAAQVKEIHGDRWSRSARDYQQTIVPIFTPITREVVRLGAIRPGETILDLGTGPGIVALQAAVATGPAGRVVGVDLAPRMIAIAAEQAHARGLDNATFVVMDAEALDSPDATFDLVLASLSLMLCPHPEAALREAHRVLKPGGRIALAVWGAAERTALGRLRILAEEFIPAPPGLTDANTLGDRDLVDRLIRAAGFVAEVTAPTVELTYRDAEHFWEAHAGSVKTRLQPDQIAAIHDRIVAELGPASPLRLPNEAIFAVGHRG